MRGNAPGTLGSFRMRDGQQQQVQRMNAETGWNIKRTSEQEAGGSERGGEGCTTGRGGDVL